MSRELKCHEQDSGGQSVPRLSLVVQQLSTQTSRDTTSTYCRESVCSSRSCVATSSRPLGGGGTGGVSGGGAPYVFRSPRVNYDVYDAELDVPKELRAHQYLVTITGVFALCLAPLMFLRVAKLALTETYENSGHFDITYTLFVWIAFLPTFTTPVLYLAWRMSRVTKERLRGYLRLSRRRRGGHETEARGVDTDGQAESEWTSATQITRN